jgi:Spy/CpxP family protein refolding chaperone
MIMMKRQRIIVLGGAACLVAAMILSGLADEGQGRMVRGQMHGGHDQGEQDEHSAHYLKHLLKHAKEIGLTSEQVSKLKVMQLDLGRTQARAEADIKIARLELHALLEDEQADLSMIQSKVDELKKAEGELLLAAIKSRRDATALLTPEQREKDRAHRERMKSEGAGQRGGGMGGMDRGGMGGMGRGGMSERGHGGRGGMGGSGHGGQGGGDQAGGGHEAEGAGGEEHKH